MFIFEQTEQLRAESQTMNAKLVLRLKRLEMRIEETRPAYRIGPIKRLPGGFDGERHVAILWRDMTEDGIEHCEFEERPGAAPSGSNDRAPTVYLSADEVLL